MRGGLETDPRTASGVIKIIIIIIIIIVGIVVVVAVVVGKR